MKHSVLISKAGDDYLPFETSNTNLSTTKFPKHICFPACRE